MITIVLVNLYIPVVDFIVTVFIENVEKKLDFIFGHWNTGHLDSALEVDYFRNITYANLELLAAKTHASICVQFIKKIDKPELC